MNIQQALNQGLISAATSAYFTGQILEQGKQSAIDKYQSAGAEKNESAKQGAITRAVQRDVYNELYNDKELGLRDGMTDDEVKDEVDALVKDDTQVAAANARQAIAKKNFQRAENNLKRWDKDRDEVDNYKTIHQTNYYKMMENLLQDVDNAKAEARALRSQKRQQETARNAETEVKNRETALDPKQSSLFWTPGQGIPQEYQPIVNDILGQKRKTEE